MVNVDDEILSNFNFSFKELQELVFSYKFIKNGNDYILKDLKSGETILNFSFLNKLNIIFSPFSILSNKKTSLSATKKS